MNISRFGRFKYHSSGLHFWSGFNAYVGYLLLEHTHANPVLVTFCQLLIKTINGRQASEEAESKNLVHSNQCSSKFIFFDKKIFHQKNYCDSLEKVLFYNSINVISVL